MQTCLHCGRHNKRSALYCGTCGDSLAARGNTTADSEALTLGGPAVYQPPPRTETRIQDRRGQGAPLPDACWACWSSCRWGRWRRDGPAGWIRPRPGRAARPRAWPSPGPFFYICLIYGYLIGKTSQSAGAPFASYFILGCLPPLTPALFARLCGRPMWKPYYQIFIDLAILLAVGWFLRELPYLLLILVFVMLPLIVHHLCGCVTGQLAGVLGLAPWVLGVWLCLVPNVLLILMMRDFLGAIDPLHARQPFALTLAQLQACYLSSDDLFAFNGFKLSVYTYLLVTLAGWIKLVYENLRIPIT